MTAKLVWIDAITQRPAMRWRTSSSASRSESASKRSASAAPRPIVFPSRIPETESDSWTTLEMSASVSCVVFAIRRRSLPTRRVRNAKIGISANANSASCQLRASMPIIVATTVVTFEAIDVAVFVTTFWTPPMSFEIRDCTSPVRVRVKNASESRWRWRKTAARRSCITRWPTWFESSVWTTPRMPVTTAIAIIPAALTESTRVSLLPDRLEHVLEQERRHDAERGRHHDQQQDAREPHPVGREERPDPPQVRAPDGGIRRTLGGRIGRMEEHAHRRSEYVRRRA